MPAPSPEQLKASDPALSAWVAANAGSGKTSVLVNRVVRLLLHGADPARILCVTFTKAAAANMQDRIFQRLGQWVALPDADLAAAMAEMEGVAPNPAQLKVARRLFARAVETPGGLKIQTIHALCERLLHLFPFEAAVPARFEMLDEAQAAASLDRAMSGTLRQALSDPDSALAEALRIVADAAGEDGVREALKAFVRHRRGITRQAPERKLALSPVRAALGVKAGETGESVASELFTDGLPVTNWQEVADWLATGTKTDVERAADLRKARGVQGTSDSVLYISIFITDKGTLRKSLATKKLAEARPDLLEDLTEEQSRVLRLLDHMKAATAATRTEAILLLADDVLARHESEKRRLGRLDFQDLISRARALLMSDAARWVRFKLDQGVDHILVDEAQDTSPEQWDIVKALADEFFDGAGARDALNRTVFAVGDEKQSIFGFQGAKPEEFDAARKHFARRIAAHNAEAQTPKAFDTISLQTSYRSTDDILSAVDQVFALPTNYQGLESASQPTVHVSNRVGVPGLMELWPPMEPPEAPEKDAAAPVDELPPVSSPQQLADRIARRISWWMRHATPVASTGAPITPGDVLILVRNRGSIFDSVIKALKRHGVPVAGADRMKLGQQLAVMDLLSLGRFCVSPEDDLALAEVLRSPLVDISETELFTLAHGRGDISLWQALQTKVQESKRFAEAAALLADCLKRAQDEDPARFYAGLLAANGFRQKLMSRLSADAAEAIDVFLYRLRQWQAANPPSLLLFLEAMQGDESDVKRDMEEAHGRVRVMTVHGSKGLEAPVVFMADLFRAPGGGKTARLFELVPGDPETAVWSPRKDDDPAATADGRARFNDADAAEHRRLLYVGLTRAKDRLIVAGARPARAVSGTWHELIEAGLAGDGRLSVAQDEAGEGEVQVWRTVPGEVKLRKNAPSPEATHAPFPWLHARASADLPRPPPIRPSRLADAAEPPPLRDRLTQRSTARLRGDLVHLLLQHLPDVSPERRAMTGEHLAQLRFPLLDAATRAEALRSALTLMIDSRWHQLFGPDARAEVDIAGRITVAGRALEVAGRIDRLLVTPSHVLVADFKTGRAPDHPADVPEGHLRQMAVYWALARDLYPTRRVEAAVIWTALPALVVLDEAAMEAALTRLSHRPG